MAHEIESAMYVKQPAWHELGVVLEDIPDTDKAYIMSGLNWNVEKQPLFYSDGYTEFDDGYETKQLLNTRVTDMFAITRDKDRLILGYCKDQYEIYQNEDAFNWCKPLAESPFWDWESAGSLKEGKVCWALLKQGEYKLAGADLLKNYLMMTWSHDGSTAVTVQPTTIRVVCNNTLQMAMGEGGSLAKVRHHKMLHERLDDVRELHDLTGQSFKTQADSFRKLIRMKMTDIQIEETVDELYPIDEESSGYAKNINTFAKDMCFGLASGHKELGIQNTGYGVAMALTEANEHYIGGNRIKSRGANILLGNGKIMNDKIVSTLLLKSA